MRSASFIDVVGPGKFVTIKPIPIEKLREYCEINHADANKSFREEFVVSQVGHFLNSPIKCSHPEHGTGLDCEQLVFCAPDCWRK